MRRDAGIQRARAAAARSAATLQSVNDPAVAAAVRGPVTNLLEGLGPSHVDEVPAPVVALGGLASLLLLAGLGTSLARVRARRLVALRAALPASAWLSRSRAPSDAPATVPGVRWGRQR